MRNSKKLIAVILTVVLLASMMVPALAVTYQAEADKLTNAGLMNGTPGTGLDTLLTRVQGITFAVRAMGKEKAVIAMTEGAIALQMAKVKDFVLVPGWATNFAAYAVQNGITNGNRLITADGKITFSSTDPLSGRQFITMMLRALGYTGITLDNCLDKAVAVGMLTASKAILFGSKAQLLRDDAAYIIYSTVNNGLVAMAGGIIPSDIRLVTKLVADGALSVIFAAANFTYVASAVPVDALQKIVVGAVTMTDSSVRGDLAGWITDTGNTDTRALNITTALGSAYTWVAGEVSAALVKVDLLSQNTRDIIHATIHTGAPASLNYSRTGFSSGSALSSTLNKLVTDNNATDNGLRFIIALMQKATSINGSPIAGDLGSNSSNILFTLRSPYVGLAGTALVGSFTTLKENLRLAGYPATFDGLLLRAAEIVNTSNEQDSFKRFLIQNSGSDYYIYAGSVPLLK